MIVYKLPDRVGGGASEPVITQVRGVLREVGDEEIRLGVGPFDLEILIPENARRVLQGRIDEIVSLHTTFYIEGNQMGGRMAPRLVGFLTLLDREFFEILCSVDGMGVRKSLRAMVRPVRELARLIQDRDVKLLSTFPGIGEASGSWRRRGGRLGSLR
jgi:Holliday junction DNA helicase RuvA